MDIKSQKPSFQLQTNQNQQLAQHLIMSANMQQALHLLQVPLQELESYLEEQVMLNPLLEMGKEEEIEDENLQDERENEQEKENQELSINEHDLTILSRLDEDWREHFNDTEMPSIKRSIDDDKLKTYLEQSIQSKISLRDQILQQAHDSFDQEEDLKVAEILTGYIDEFGFLNNPLSEICSLHSLAENKVMEVLKVIQTFEPYGIGASTIQDSLLIQLRCLNKEHSLAYLIIQDYYEQLLHNQIPFIQKQLKRSYEEIQEAIEKDIAKLDLHPGTHFSAPAVSVIIPDVTLRQENDQLIVEVERDYPSPLRLNHHYLKLLKDPATSKDTKQFIKHHLFSAKWLARNLQHRYSTLERIAQTLAQKQYKFFTDPKGQLTPLTMKIVADELDIHESTVARTVSNKYLNSPRGILPLKSFFTNQYVSEIDGENLSATTVKEAILALINQEDKTHPLSDEKISLALKNQGITCARRTIAKYRFMLQIGNTQQRRKFS